MEFYQIEVVSDKAVILNDTAYFGTYGATAATQDLYRPENFHFKQAGWFDTNVTLGYGINMFWPHVNFNSKTFGQSGGGYGSKTSSVSWKAIPIMEANAITITVRRLGWVTFSGNSTTATLSEEITSQVQLERFGEGWLYNDNYIPVDMLSHVDLGHPNL